MREVIIDNEKLYKILDQRGSILKTARQIQKEVEEKQKEQQKIGYKMNRLKDKTEPFIKDIELEEFEVISSIGIKKGKVVATVVNQIEEYKKLLREKNEDSSDNKSDSK